MEHHHFQSEIHLQSGSMFYCHVRNQLGGFPPHLPWRSPRRRHDCHGFFRHRNAWTRAFGRFLSAGRQSGWLCDYPPRNKHLHTRKWMVEIRSFPFGMVHFQGLSVSFRHFLTETSSSLLYITHFDCVGPGVWVGISRRKKSSPSTETDERRTSPKKALYNLATSGDSEQGSWFPSTKRGVSPPDHQKSKRKVVR